MAKKCPLDKLAEAVEDILEEYGEDVRDNLQDITKRVTKEGVKAVKAGSKQKFGGSGKYAKGWTSKIESDRLSAQGVIYNKDLPGLPHLLENDHAKRGGGRVPGKAHIKPVERQVIKQFENLVEREL